MKQIALLIFGLFFVLASGAWADLPQGPVSAEQAGQVPSGWTRVCGNVAQVAHVPQMTNQPTFVYLDQPFPHQKFEIVIWGDVRRGFTRPPEVLYSGKKVCVAGVDRKFQGISEMIVDHESQITVVPDNK